MRPSALLSGAAIRMPASKNRSASYRRPFVGLEVHQRRVDCCSWEFEFKTNQVNFNEYQGIDILVLEDVNMFKVAPSEVLLKRRSERCRLKKRLQPKM